MVGEDRLPGIAVEAGLDPAWMPSTRVGRVAETSELRFPIGPFGTGQADIIRAAFAQCVARSRCVFAGSAVTGVWAGWFAI